MSKLNKILAISNLIVWTFYLISLFFIDYDVNCLRVFATGSMLVIVMFIGFDLLGSRKVKIKREAKAELLSEIEGEFNKKIKEKQGKK